MELAGGKLRLDEPAEHVTRLTIDNPAKRNALDHEILDAFAATLPTLGARCLLITATGPVFSAGYDIRASTLSATALSPTCAARGARMPPAPVIYARPAQVRRRHRRPRTRELFFTARNVSASTALQWGLVNEIAAPGEVAACGLAYATRIAGNAPLSLEGNKRALRELLAAEGPLDPEIERELIERREAGFQSEDFFEGVRAFAEKRPPRWQGR